MKCPDKDSKNLEDSIKIFVDTQHKIPYEPYVLEFDPNSISELVSKLGYSQRFLAWKLGFCVSTVNRWAQGIREPTDHNLKKLVDFAILNQIDISFYKKIDGFKKSDHIVFDPDSIPKLLSELDLSYSLLGMKIGVTNTTIYTWVKGKKTPHKKNVMKLVDLAGKHNLDILFYKNSKKQSESQETPYKSNNTNSPLPLFEIDLSQHYRNPELIGQTTGWLVKKLVTYEKALTYLNSKDHKDLIPDKSYRKIEQSVKILYEELEARDFNSL